LKAKSSAAETYDRQIFPLNAASLASYEEVQVVLVASLESVGRSEIVAEELLRASNKLILTDLMLH